VKAGALNATLTSSVTPFPLGLQINCNTRIRPVGARQSSRELDIFLRFCEKLPSRAIFLLFAFAGWNGNLGLRLRRQGKLVVE
jgi:hypothetical protein